LYCQSKNQGEKKENSEKEIFGYDKLTVPSPTTHAAPT
jgi:hypothetical protein